MKKIFEKYGWTDNSVAGVELWTKESSQYFVVVRGDSWEAKRRGSRCVSSDRPVASGYEEHLEKFLQIAN